MNKIVFIVFPLATLLIVCSIVSCKTKDNNLESLSFNEKDYKLINTTKDDLGNKYLEEYVNINDTQVRLKKTFWENGKVQSVVFFKGIMKNGPNDFYDSNGDLMYSGFYYADKETGVTIEYNRQLQKATIKRYSNGDVLHSEERKK